MKQIFKILTQKNIGCGYLYFYIHFIVEVICFYFLSKVTNGSNFIWLIPFIYDGLAFVPQALIGYLNDLYPKLKIDFIGITLLFILILMYSFTNVSIYIFLIILCLGNACLHISGAENTLKNSNGNLSHSAIFVAGGSFGVISGKLLAMTNIPSWILLFLILTLIPFVLLANTYNSKDNNCNKFDYTTKSLPASLIIIFAVLVVIVRGYMGYGIPTSWNKTIIQTIILYVTMGFGKTLGGILSDRFGIRKIAVISTIFSIPLLCFGNDQMIVSLLGVMMFSMTMPITLGVLVSILKNRPGLAFGLTTIGLFLGTTPIFFIKITNEIFNIFLIIVLSILCCILLLLILRKDNKHDRMDI